MNLRLALRLLLRCAVAFAGISSLHAKARAVIVIGLTNGQVEMQHDQDQAAQLKAVFFDRQVEASAVTVVGLGGAARRDEVLAALSAHAADFDETWIILLGAVAPGHAGEPSFQTVGPRLGAGAFAAAVDTIPGRKFIIVATTSGGGFLPALGLIKNVEAVSATRESGELNRPFFTEAWIAAARAHPEKSFHELALEASQHVAHFYADQNLAQTEHASGFDAARQEVVAIESIHPTGPAAAPAKQPPDQEKPELVLPSPAAPPALPVVENPLPSPPEDNSFRTEPATPETRQLIAEAQAQSARFDYAAVTLNRSENVIVDSSGATSEIFQVRSFIRTGDAIDELATLRFPQDPKTHSQLISARVIRPDGSQQVLSARTIVFNKKQPRREDLEDRAIQLPNVSVGCVVELEWQTDTLPDDQLNRFYREWLPVDSYPILHDTFVCTYPSGKNWHLFAANLAQPPVITHPSASSVTATWKDFPLKPFDALAGDPPLRDWRPWFGLSAFDSWDQFSDWYRRLMLDVLASGPTVKALAAEIRQVASTRDEQLKLAYQKVAEIRYVAIELGIGAIRPRTPNDVLERRFGDCKDKASLLVVLLKELGVSAEFALVNRGGSTFLDLPGWQFNHAIVRVPAFFANAPGGDLWLDATDRIVPFGVLSPGISGRAALLISEKEGAHFTNVALESKVVSTWVEHWRLFANGSANSNAQVTLSAQGAAETELRRQFAGLSPAQRALRAEMVLSGSHPAFSINAVKMGDPYDLRTHFQVKLDLQLQSKDSPRPSPPNSKLWFATESRDRPLTLHDEQISTYRQEIELNDTQQSAAFSESTQSAAGVDFSRKREGSLGIVEINLPEKPISPDDYPALRVAWRQFTATSSFPPL